MVAGKRKFIAGILALFTVVALWQGFGNANRDLPLDTDSTGSGDQVHFPQDDFVWRRIKQHYPVKTFIPLPRRKVDRLPKVQAEFREETAADKETRLKRQSSIKAAFGRSWEAYKKHAWLRDELTPVSGKEKDPFGGWGATLIDSLDTLWIMDMNDEFALAVDAVHHNISFATTKAEQINVFETTIRFLGGLLSAYDLSGERRLLFKARDVGDMLYKAFDTPNHLPVTRWDLHAAARGEKQTAPSAALVAELGSLSMEFTRLSIVTGDPKYYDAVQRIAELFLASQKKTKLPGMWPLVVNAAEQKLDGGIDFSLGAMADSVYEYLVKMVALLGDRDSIYRGMYLSSIDAAQERLFFRPMVPGADDILFSGEVRISENKMALQPTTGHLTCFVGGMLALGGQIMAKKAHVDMGGKFTKGCIWAYHNMKTGVMPETFHLVPCADVASCAWNETQWHDAIGKEHNIGDAEGTISAHRLPKGFTKISDPRYLLRPEAIESVFVMYRVTGDPFWREKAWEMWTSIENTTRTDLAYSAVKDVNLGEGDKVGHLDSMESFWMGETLKYFYLIFSEPGLVNLNEWVFNTEAHPFKRLG